MKTSSRPRELGGSFSSRRGHGAQLSISDTNHHVTEAIGDMYGDDDAYGKRESRPLSFVVSPHGEPVDADSFLDSPSGSSSRSSPSRLYTPTNGNMSPKSHTLSAPLPNQRNGSIDAGSLSPSRENNHGAKDTGSTSFPLDDIDYESNPAAVAQELSNLQALRRMSMDVGNTSDPDLPPFQGMSLMPSVAPRGGDDEDDPSRLFWVPARVHPELAPMEFQTFLENRVQTIKRRSGELSSLSTDKLDRSGSTGGLRRKKSMLSRQIDNTYGRGADGYKDGAEKLEQKKSLSRQRNPDLKISDLKDLDDLVKDPSMAMKKLTLDTNMRNDLGAESSPVEDMPILPAAPGNGLRRSTRTTYRRGSLRKGERVPFSRRVEARAEIDWEEPPISSPGNLPPEPRLLRVSSEPITENFSRPVRPGLRSGRLKPGVTSPMANYGQPEIITGIEGTIPTSLITSSIEASPSESIQHVLPPRKSSFNQSQTQIPQIIETPPVDDHNEKPPSKQSIQYVDKSPGQAPSQVLDEIPAPSEPPPRSSKRPVLGRQASSTTQAIPKVSSTKPLNNITQNSSLPPGGIAKNNALTSAPTLNGEKKPEKKAKKDDTESPSVRKTSWGWFKGSDDKDKKDRKKDDDVKKGKSKTALDKTHDSARLDVLQHSIETGAVKGRESIFLERESIDNKLLDERKKESSRKSGEGKKERDGIFHSLFGSKKKDRDQSGKKGGPLRSLSPEPPYRRLKPDVDYSWTRFSILEERAIYRMAHIKLANPRRALHSQVLLSNFMYSYLAKVQQMHPHVQIAQSPQQKKQQDLERRQKEEEKRRLEEPQQGSDQYKYDYHQGIVDYADPPNQQSQPGESVAYVEDSQIYDYDHQENNQSRTHGVDRPQSRASQHSIENSYGMQNPNQNQYGRQGQAHYQYGSPEHAAKQKEADEEDMW